MTARPLLMILNPRDMRECMGAFKALTVPKAYLTGYTERELCTIIPILLAETDYTHYVAISDDTVVTQRAVDHLYEHLGNHPVVTGWCNLDQASPLCSVVDKPLEGETPTRASYSFMHWTRVQYSATPLLRTWFAGMCLTGMSRDMWARYPFDVFPGGDLGGFASDYRLCWRLQQDQVPVIAVRDANVLHVREQWDVPDREPRKRLLIGKVTPRVEVIP